MNALSPVHILPASVQAETPSAEVQTALLDALQSVLRKRIAVLGKCVAWGTWDYSDALHDIMGGSVLTFCEQHDWAWDAFDDIEDDVADRLADAVDAFGQAAAPLPVGPLLHSVRLPGRTATGLPPYYPAPTESKLDALVRLDLTITGFIQTQARIVAAHRVAAQRRSEARDEDPDATPRDKSMKSRRINAEVAAEFGYGKRIPRAARLHLSGSQGIGKTALFIKGLAEVPDAIAVRVVMPSLVKADEAHRDYIAAAKRDSLASILVRGRAAPDPEAPLPRAGESAAAMCPRHEVAAEISRNGLSVRKALCSACPLAADCGYLRQAARIKAMGGTGVYFMAHAGLFTPSPAPVADLTIVDEFISGRDVVEVPIWKLTRDALPYEGGNLPAYTAAQNTIEAVHLALAHPATPDALRAAGVTPDALPAALAHPAALATLRAQGVTKSQLQDAVRLLDAFAHPDSSIVNGAMPDSVILDRMAGIQATGAGQAITVLRAVLREWERTRATLTGVTLKEGKLTVSRIKGPVGIGQGGVLLLDGTGTVEGHQRKLFGDRLQGVTIRFERMAHVTGTTGKGYSLQSITGRDMFGAPRPQPKGKVERPDWQDTSARLRQEIATIAERQPGPCLVVTPKGARDMLGDHLTSDLPQATYGATRGLNTWEDCESVVTVGVQPLSMANLEALARCDMADDDAPFISADTSIPADWGYRDRGWPYWATRMRRMRDGTVSPVEVPIHPDPRVQAVLEQVREAEVIQGADRVRPMFQQRHLVLMNRLALDVTYDKIVTHAELVAGVNRYEDAFAAKGMRPRGARGLHAMFPALFPTLKAAEKWIERGGLSTPYPQTESCLSRGGTHLYRLKGQGGSLSRIDINRLMHPDPRAALEAEYGPLAWFEAVDAPAPVEAAPAVAPAAPMPDPAPVPSPLRPHGLPSWRIHMPILPPMPSYAPPGRKPPWRKWRDMEPPPHIEGPPYWRNPSLNPALTPPRAM